jgi:hypothetical protein
MATKLFGKELSTCTADEKVSCATKGREAMLATVFIMKADKGRYSKLLTDLHDAHLTGFRLWRQYWRQFWGYIFGGSIFP